MDRSMLARATEGTDAPTPGYLYVDLAKAASSNPAVCQEMASYLTRRLASKNNPNIQYKCCKVIAKLADSVPRNQFRRCIAQDPSAVSIIKQATAFRGTPDPVRGDQPNQKVRDAAKEALDAVYREAPSSEQQYASHTASNISASYAPSPHYSGGGGGGYSGGGGGGGGGRLDGIGNPRYSDPRYGPQQPSNFREAVKEAREVVVGMIKDPLARHVDAPAPAVHVPRQGHSGDLPGYNRSQNYGRPPPGSAELSRQTGGQWTMASNRGPGAVQYQQQQPQQQQQPPHSNGASDSYYKERDTSFQWAKQQGGAHTSSSGAVGGSWASAGAGPSSSSSVIRPHSSPSVTINTLPSSGGGAAASDGTYEKNLVLELCPPGGMKAVPPPDKLANFARSVSSLNSDLICPVLLDCLEEGQPWIIRAKALCVMETCIQHGTRPADGSNPYRDFFHACLDEITPLANHPRTAISQPAQRVLALLGVASAGGTANGGSVAAPPVAAAPNLLDFDDDDAPATPAPAPASQPPPPPSTPVTAAPSPGQSTMFGGMQVKAAGGVTSPTPAAATAPATNGDLLGDFGAAPASSESNNAAAPAPANTSSAPPSDMFAQMSLKAGNSSSAAAAAAPAQPSAAQPAAANSNSTVSGDLASLAAPAGGGSAFGFINESAPKDSSDKTTTADQQAKANKNPESFDPLKNLTPQSSQQRKMMQLSPEQMQAMAYQQQVFHMQQQQMQMMLAMQQQQGGMMHHPSGQPPMFPNMGGVMPPQGAGQQQRFSFKDTRPAKKDDKKFDFVKDAMHTAGQKK